MQKPFLSQVFLLDREVVAGIADAIPLKGKTVLEIGAGEGILTQALARKAKKVVAVEIDRDLLPKLRHNLAGLKNVELNFVDARELDFTAFKTIFGALPYHIATPLLVKMIESQADDIVVVVQKEFGLRLAAKPGSKEYSRLSILCQNNCDCRVLFEVSRFSFLPAPEVDSIAVHLHRNKKFNLNEQLVSLLFQHKNQTVRNALVHSHKALGLEKSEVKIRAGKSVLAGKKVLELTLEDLNSLSKTFKAEYSVD
jgi:16S rRNA (adenine1518-N6/adenine1519-N6)-dimethyltransferase